MPIVTTQNDIIAAGHGTYPSATSTFVLPAHVDLYLILPLGYILTDGPVTALVGRQPIDRLAIKTATGVTDLQPMGMPTVYKGGKPAPNLILHDLEDLRTTVTAAIPVGANNVFTVTADTTLQDLLNRSDVRTRMDAIQTAHPGANVRLFWAACAKQATNPDPGLSVYCNAKALAFAATAHVQALNKAGHLTDGALDAALAVLNAATVNQLDTASAIAAAAPHDPATANLLHAL
jgi:hypothetical protein